jgi:hypothetical protein
MRLVRIRTKRLGVIALDWWWPEAGCVLWIGGMIRWKTWGSRWGYRRKMLL